MSLTSFICKVFEMVVEDMRIHHLCEAVFSFPPSRVLPLVDPHVSTYLFFRDLLSALNKRVQLKIVYIGYTKAFSVVYPVKLLLKLKKNMMSLCFW